MNRVELLRDASISLGIEAIDLIAPPSMTVHVGAHSTGCQPRIVLKADDLPAVDVWLGSIWYSSIYEFNDRNKVLGIQPGLEWAKPQIDAFFDTLAAMVEENKTKVAERSALLLQQREQERKDTIAEYQRRQLADHAETGATA